MLQPKTKLTEASKPDLLDQTHDVRRDNTKSLTINVRPSKLKFFLLVTLIHMLKNRNINNFCI